MTKNDGHESSAETLVQVSYNCNCLKNASMPATSTRPGSLLTAIATGTPVPVSPRQSDLAEWVGKKLSANPSDAAATMACKGIIKILVEEDISHPVEGIKGQKVTVTIVH
jgi:hypothetical protein